MIVWSRLCATSLLAFLVVFPSCGSDEKTKTGTAAANGTGGAAEAGPPTGGTSTGGTSTGGTSGTTGGTGGDTVTCGSQMCTAPTGASFSNVTPCCQDSGECGLNWSISPECLAPSLPGTSDPTCVSFAPPTGMTLEGCCGPSGCGAINPFMGCVPNSVLGRPDVACMYDPTNDCSQLTEVTCDGAEDCPSGQQCCTRFAGNGFTDFGCYDSCAALNADAGSADWRQLCHAGDTCEDPTYTCTTSVYLPTFLTRCYNMGTAADTTLSSAADEINCGAQTCGSGEKCCLRDPYEPFCAPATDDCKCHPAGLDAGP